MIAPGEKHTPENSPAVVQNAIIVHTHKCGGTSLKHALVAAFGPAQVREDYTHGMQNPGSLLNLDPERYWRQVSCEPVRGIAIGHFPITAYAHVGDALRIALLRHPVDRMISHYFFWRGQTPPNEENKLWHSVRRGEFSLEEFCRVPLISGLYRHGYFRDFDMRRLDLLIVHERMAKGVTELSQLLGHPISLPLVNTTSLSWSGYETAKSAIRNDRRLWNELCRSLSDEITFYESCLSLPNAA
jgi:hypothetical protein